MKQVYFDWSLRNGVTYVTDDSDEVQHVPSTDALLDQLHEPHRIICESTVHSYIRDDRLDFIERCKREGHELVSVPTRATGRWSREMRRPKSDFNDPLTIRDEVAGGAHLKRIVPHDHDLQLFREKRTATNYELMLMRAKGEKDAYAKSIIRRFLPDYADLEPYEQLALGNGKEYSLVGIAALGLAAERAQDRREFERLCGLYAHGYPSQIRADIYHWLYSGGAKRGRLDGEKIFLDGESKDKGGYGLRKRKDGLSLSEFRKACHHVYAWVNA